MDVLLHLENDGFKEKTCSAVFLYGCRLKSFAPQLLPNSQAGAAAEAKLKRRAPRRSSARSCAHQDVLCPQRPGQKGAAPLRVSGGGRQRSPGRGHGHLSGGEGCRRIYCERACPERRALGGSTVSVRAHSAPDTAPPVVRRTCWAPCGWRRTMVISRTPRLARTQGRATGSPQRLSELPRRREKRSSGSRAQCSAEKLGSTVTCENVAMEPGEGGREGDWERRRGRGREAERFARAYA